jgi:hypothetical protein
VYVTDDIWEKKILRRGKRKGRKQEEKERDKMK